MHMMTIQCYSYRAKAISKCELKRAAQNKVSTVVSTYYVQRDQVINDCECIRLRNCLLMVVVIRWPREGMDGNKRRGETCAFVGQELCRQLVWYYIYRVTLKRATDDRRSKGQLINI